MSLKEWFGKGSKGDWVDIGAPKKKGKFQACGRSKVKGSKRKYPKCVPRSKAKAMTEGERRSAVKRKRAKPQGVGGKPTNVKTFTSPASAKGRRIVKKVVRFVATIGVVVLSCLIDAKEQGTPDVQTLCGRIF
jgi:hypothetical protein